MEHFKNKVLTIAGSDSGAGAGIQADLKTFAALGVYGTSVLTAVTAQNSTGVQDVRIMDEDIINSQIDSVLSDIGASAVKTGMLANSNIIKLVSKKIEFVLKIRMALAALYLQLLLPIYPKANH